MAWITAIPLMTGPVPSPGNNYNYIITGLSASTSYQYRAYMIIGGVEYFGNIYEITTGMIQTQIPTVITTAISAIGTTTALGGGNVTSDGGSTITARGVVWGIAPNPTTANSHTSEMGTTGSYISSLTGLASNTTHYVRAYAINSVGTAYGAQETFVTNPNGNIFYVKNTGSDSNTGLSDAQAWQTLNKINITTFQAGDTILFNRGDTFRGYLWITNENGSAANSITFDAYGSGNKPRIWGSKDYSSSSLWTNYSGNIWKTTSPVTTAYDVANLIFNNETSYGIKKTTIGTCTIQGDWFITTDNISGDKCVYLYSTSNPGTYYTHIEIGGAFIGDTEEVIRIDNASYITVRNLDVRYSPNNGIIAGWGASNIVIEYNDVSWIGGMYVNGDYPYRMGNGIGVWANGAYTVSNVIIRYNRVDQCYDAGISPQGDVLLSVNNIQMYYNIISNCGYSYEFWVSAGAVAIAVNFYNNTCFNAGGNWSNGQRPDTGNVRHVMIWDLSGNLTSCNIKNNIFMTCQNEAVRIDNYDSKIYMNYNLYNVAIIGLLHNGVDSYAQTDTMASSNRSRIGFKKW